MGDKRGLFGFDLARRSSLYEQIADQVEYLIITRKLNPGDKLYPERELVDMMKVSRPTIREAMKVLRDRDLLEHRPGDGTYVKAIDSSVVYGPIYRYFLAKDRPYLELMQIRTLIEPGVAGLVAENPDPAALAELEKTVKELQDALDDPETYSEIDLRFHVGLIKATGNAMLLVILTPILGMMKDEIRDINEIVRKTSVPKGPEHHREILDCIERGAAEDAREAMRSHLSVAQKDIEKLYRIRQADVSASHRGEYPDAAD